MGKGETVASLERVYRIGEVAEIVGVEPYVLRYWETEFPTLHPAKSPHGQRLYRDSDIEAALAIKELLYEEGFTIAGARKHLPQESQRPPVQEATSTEPSAEQPAPHTPPLPPATNESNAHEVLRAVRDELQALLTRLKK